MARPLGRYIVMAHVVMAYSHGSSSRQRSPSSSSKSRSSCLHPSRGAGEQLASIIGGGRRHVPWNRLFSKIALPTARIKRHTPIHASTHIHTHTSTHTAAHTAKQIRPQDHVPHRAARTVHRAIFAVSTRLSECHEAPPLRLCRW